MGSRAGKILPAPAAAANMQAAKAGARRPLAGRRSSNRTVEMGLLHDALKRCFALFLSFVINKWTCP